MISSCITPTDPVLAASVVKGRFAEERVPPYVRDIIAAESGANDGLGFPFMYIALFLVERNTHHHSLGWSIWEWIVQTWLYDIALSCGVGVVIGFIASKTLKFARTRGLIGASETLLSQFIELLKDSLLSRSRVLPSIRYRARLLHPRCLWNHGGRCERDFGPIRYKQLTVLSRAPTISCAPLSSVSSKGRNRRLRHSLTRRWFGRQCVHLGRLLPSWFANYLRISYAVSSLTIHSFAETQDHAFQDVIDIIVDTVSGLDLT